MFCGLHFQFHRAHYYLWKGKETPFIPPEEGRAAEASQSLFSYTDGKIRDGYGEDGCEKKVVASSESVPSKIACTKLHKYPFKWFSSDCYTNPNVMSLTPEMICNNGYEFETHEVLMDTF
ncbi:hypothetical protein MTP99_002429 [Tenebrio molitor]|nr:hypothetical protein MTP99_002429 [Tenebrio molitor]